VDAENEDAGEDVVGSRGRSGDRLERFQDRYTLSDVLRGCRSLVVASTRVCGFEVQQSWNRYGPRLLHCPYSVAHSSGLGASYKGLVHIS